MEPFPRTAHTPLVRTAFGDEAGWRDLLAEIARESPDGFRAHVSTIEDRSLAGARPEDLAIAAAAIREHAILLVADERAMEVGDGTLLAVRIAAPFPMFRVARAALWMVENNLSIGNLDFADFVGALESDGVFRDFPYPN